MGPRACQVLWGFRFVGSEKAFALHARTLDLSSFLRQSLAAMDAGTAAGSRQPKKVRLACERCRDRRIKVCFGAATERQKKAGTKQTGSATEKSLHVTTAPRPKCPASTLIPAPPLAASLERKLQCLAPSPSKANRPLRFQLNAAARIEWLENIIRTRLPDVDLSAGPQLVNPDASTSSAPPAPPLDQAPASNLAIGQNRGIKRSYATPSQEHGPNTSVEQSARSMALHLGLLTLDVNSSQVHYLGSSSGSLFTPMLQANREDAGALPSASSHETSDGSHTDPFDVYEQFDETRPESYHLTEVRRVYGILKAVSRPHQSHRSNLIKRFTGSALET